MKKYQIVTYDKYGGYDEKLDFDTIQQAKENINLYTDYECVCIINKETKQTIYIKHNRKHYDAEKISLNRQKVLNFITQELFDYYDEEDYQSFSNGIIDVIFKNGNMLQILN